MSGIQAEKQPFIRKYIFSTNHKVIAIQYLITGIVFLTIGGLMAFIMRWQLAYPWKPIPLLGQLFFRSAGGAVMPEVYSMLFTMHGGIMVFFAITPILLGALGNYTIPLEVGARDMAFPRLNMLSYWMLFLGSVLILVSFFVPGGAAGSGWTIYAPLSSSTKVNPGWGQDLFILGLALDATSILMGGINYITTILHLRAPGMTLGRMPLTTWGLFFTSVLNTFWLPIVASALFMVLFDRRLDTAFFVAGPLAPREGGQVLLYQHLFWGFGHPEVYILIFPVWGLVGDLLSVFSRKPAFGYKTTVLSMVAITVLSGIVWGHHMYTSGMNPLVGKAFVFLTITISVPTAIFFLNWLGTLWRGAIRFRTPMLFALGVVFVFAVGGLTGLFNALQAFDIYIHDTYFVVGHFHYTLAASVLFGAFAFIYFWYPKIFGREMNPGLGKLHFWSSFIFLNLVFFGMFVVGLHGHMRRIADATAYEFLKPIQSWNVFMAWAALGLVASQFLFFHNFFSSLRKGKRASHNPWEAGSLAWSVSSPPPLHNFEQTPIVYHGPHEYGIPFLKDRDWLAQNDSKIDVALMVDERFRPVELQTVTPAFLGISMGKLGMWVFLISEIMLFTGLIGSYIVLRLGSTGWPNPRSVLNTGLLGLNTFVLITSSLTMALSLDAVRKGNQSAFKCFLIFTALLGLTFLGIKGYDYVHMWHRGFTLNSSLFGSCYYLLTGFHAAHVFSGVILLTYLFGRACQDRFSASNYVRVEASGLYWHFIDIVWVILFAILCLV